MDVDVKARRNAHRKRVSVARLSSDTLSVPLSTYTTSKPWSRSAPSLVQLGGNDQDLPPEYPDSADEADEETDDVQDLPYSPPPPSWTSPRRRNFRRHSSQFSQQHRELLENV